MKLLLSLACFLLLNFPDLLCCATPSAPLDFLTYGLNLKGNRWQQQSHIRASNIESTRLRWSFSTGPLGSDVSCTPTVVGDFVYVTSWSGKVFALNDTDGSVVWQRNITSRATPTVGDDLLLISSLVAGTIHAVNRFTGADVWTTVIETHPFATVTMSGTVFDGKYLIGVSSTESFAGVFVPGLPCCTFRGSFVALDLATGAILWKLRTIDDSLQGQFAGAPVWGSSPSVLESERLVFFGTGNNYFVPNATADCLQVNPPQQCKVPGNHPDSLFAVSVDSGSVRWVKSFYGVDYYTLMCELDPSQCVTTRGPDYDFPQGPILVKVKGKWSIGVGSKSGSYFLVEALTGNTVWSVPVGPGGNLGGLGWGSAADESYFYVAVVNSFLLNFTIDGQKVCSGGWASIRQKDGKIMWFTPALPPVTFAECAQIYPYPFGNLTLMPIAIGALTLTNDLVITTSVRDGTLVVMRQKDGQIVYTNNLGNNQMTHGGVAVTEKGMYLGSGYARWGSLGNMVYAFAVDD